MTSETLNDSIGAQTALREAAGDARETSRQQSAERLVAVAKSISRARFLRKHYFSPDLFAEPAWEMLLELYQVSSAGHRMSVSNLCLASQAPETTALRWIDKLLELGMIEKRKNKLDARVIFVELNPSTRVQMEAYLKEIREGFCA